MSAQKYRDLLEDVRQKFNAGDVNGYIEDFYAPDAHFHFLPPGLPQGQEGARLFYAGFIAAFPDAQFTPDDTIIQDDRLVTRYHLEMTHLGEFQGIPPTGRRVRLDGISFMRFADGKVAERWNEADFLGLMRQLGAIPDPEGN